MRNCSSANDLRLSRSSSSSDFEFEFSLGVEPPVSPKLLAATGFSHKWETALQPLQVISSTPLDDSWTDDALVHAAPASYNHEGSYTSDGAAAAVELHDGQHFDAALNLSSYSHQHNLHGGESVITVLNDSSASRHHRLISFESDLGPGADQQPLEAGDDDDGDGRQQQHQTVIQRRRNLGSLITQEDGSGSRDLSPPLIIGSSCTASRQERQKEKAIVEDNAVDRSPTHFRWIFRISPSQSSSSSSAASSRSSSCSTSSTQSSASGAPTSDCCKSRRWSSKLQDFLKKACRKCDRNRHPIDQESARSEKQQAEYHRDQHISHELISQPAENFHLINQPPPDYRDRQQGSHQDKGCREWAADCTLERRSPQNANSSPRLNRPETTSDCTRRDDGLSRGSRVAAFGDPDIAIVESTGAQATWRLGDSNISSRTMKQKRGQISGTINRKVTGANSAPVSPARSPARNGDALSPARMPTSVYRSSSPVTLMSRHAQQYYQQHRVRSEELRKRTFLPYRQSLMLGARFCHSTPHSALMSY